MAAILRILPCTLLALILSSVGLTGQSLPLQGSFTLDPEASDDVEQAIRTATARLNFAIRSVARGRLRRTNTPSAGMTIAHTTAEVTIISDDGAPVVSPSTGQPVPWTRESGETVDVSTRWVEDRLRQRFEAGDGVRENLFQLSPDGRTLMIEVTVWSPSLPEPLSYTLVYRRDR